MRACRAVVALLGIVVAPCAAEAERTVAVQPATSPVSTPDRLALAVLWTAYCIAGPRFKERRYERRYGDAFRRYQADVPYMAPRLEHVP